MSRAVAATGGGAEAMPVRGGLVSWHGAWVRSDQLRWLSVMDVASM